MILLLTKKVSWKGKTDATGRDQREIKKRKAAV